MNRFENRVCRFVPCASFGYAPQAVNTIDAGGVVPFNTVIQNLSTCDCKRFIDLNTGTGNIFIKERGKYNVTVRLDVPAVADTWIILETGNGEDPTATIYNVAGDMSWDVKIKEDSVIKVVVGGTGPIVFTPAATTTPNMALITITKIS